MKTNGFEILEPDGWNILSASTKPVKGNQIILVHNYVWKLNFFSDRKNKQAYKNKNTGFKIRKQTLAFYHFE